MGTVDQPRDSNGRWASTGSVGRQPVKSSGGQPSVHTRLSRAARENIIKGKGVDQRHFPIRTDAYATGLTDRQGPMAGLTATPGRFKYQPPKRSD